MKRLDPDTMPKSSLLFFVAPIFFLCTRLATKLKDSSCGTHLPFWLHDVSVTPFRSRLFGPAFSVPSFRSRLFGPAFSVPPFRSRLFGLTISVPNHYLFTSIWAHYFGPKPFRSHKTVYTKYQST